MSLKPFFTYFGGKWRAAPRYPAPQHATIVEPFAGSAGYALRHHERDVLLIDAAPAVVDTWRYLIGASPSEIRDLPDLRDGETVDDLKVPAGARLLIGWWLNKGVAHPCKRPSAWMRSGEHVRSFWGHSVRSRIAAQVSSIRHWRVELGTYANATNITATWFVDPPYQVAGTKYPHGSREIDFAALASWCRTRRGQVVVCENAGATWLPFVPFEATKAMSSSKRAGWSHEAIWHRGEQSCLALGAA